MMSPVELGPLEYGVVSSRSQDWYDLIRAVGITAHPVPTLELGWKPVCTSVCVVEHFGYHPL